MYAMYLRKSRADDKDIPLRKGSKKSLQYANGIG